MTIGCTIAIFGWLLGIIIYGLAQTFIMKRLITEQKHVNVETASTIILRSLLYFSRLHLDVNFSPSSTPSLMKSSHLPQLSNFVMEASHLPQLSNSCDLVTTEHILSGRIPKIIHITDKDTSSIRFANDWTEMNPEFKLCTYDDNQAWEVITKTFPDFIPLRNELLPVEIADIFRYAVLYFIGGIYIDSDVRPLKPISEWLPHYHHDWTDVDFVFGMEFPEKGERGYQFEQWCIISSKGNSFFPRLMKNILSAVNELSKDKWHIEDRTGPHIWTDTLMSFFNDSEVSLGMVDDWPMSLPAPHLVEDNGQTVEFESMKITILPYRAFSWNMHHKTWMKLDKRNRIKDERLIEHWFSNSWRKKQHGRLV